MRWIWLCFFLCAEGGVMLFAQEPDVQTSTSKNLDVSGDDTPSGATATGVVQPKPEADDAVREVLRTYVDAINRRDFDRLMPLLAQELRYRDTSLGLNADGRDVFVAQITEALRESRAVLTAEIRSIRFKDPRCAIVLGGTSIGNPDDEPDHFSFEVTVEKNRTGGWKIRTIIEEAVPRMERDRVRSLQALAWLEGTWKDETENSATSQFRFLPGRNFLVRTFENREDRSGFQVIGYDAVEGKVRSWSYFSDGAFGEATWEFDGAKIRVKSLQRLANGTLAAGTSILEKTSQDSMTIKLVGREIDGVIMPNGRPVEVRRLSGNKSDSRAPGVKR